MIKCICIDDEPLALKQMVSYIEKTPFLELVSACESAITAIDVLQNNAVDLMFVDINMPDLNGIEFVKSIEKPPKIIFTTAYSEYALESYKVDAMDYLLKPIAYVDFLKASQKVHDWMELKQSTQPDNLKSNDDYLFIKSEYKIIRINFKDIKYIEGMREYVRIHLDNQKPVMSLMSMKGIEKHLPENIFMRVHRSFIVNLSKVSVVEKQRIIFDGSIYIPISEQYKDKFQDFINRNFL
jgi:DNA-binding LytR/AlgR family response regulator